MKNVLSIIIPVYNAEKYLKECLDSVQSIAFKEWECILVDDGSKDKSGQICDSYSQIDDRFRVIHKENGGVSSARNVGIELAKSEWIGFIDSDDWITKDYASELNERIDADAVHFGYKKEKNNHEYADCVSNATGNLTIEQFLTNQNYSPCSWSYFYRKSIIKKGGIVFDKSLKYSEDTLFIVEYLLNSKNIFVSECTHYYYRYNDGSAVHTKRNFSHSADDLCVLDKLLAPLDVSSSKSIREFVFNFQFDNFSNALTFYTKLLKPWQYAKLISQYRYYYSIGEKKYSVKYNRHNKIYFFIPIINMIYRYFKVWVYRKIFR